MRCEDLLRGRIAWRQDRLLRCLGLIALWYLVRYSQARHLSKLWSICCVLQVWDNPIELQQWMLSRCSSVYVLLTPFWKTVYVGMIEDRPPDDRWQEHIRCVIQPPESGAAKYRVLKRRAPAACYWMLPAVSGLELPKQVILRAEKWVMNQFSQRLNNLRRRWNRVQKPRPSREMVKLRDTWVDHSVCTCVHGLVIRNQSVVRTNENLLDQRVATVAIAHVATCGSAVVAVQDAVG